MVGITFRSWPVALWRGSEIYAIFTSEARVTSLDPFVEKAAADALNEIKSLAGQVEFLLRALEARNPDVARSLRQEVLALIESAGETAARQRRADPQILKFEARGGGEGPEKLPEIENDIMSIIDAEDGPVSLSALYERLQDIGQDIAKGTLSVRLHRMVTHGRLISPARTMYALSPAERTKRAQGVA